MYKHLIICNIFFISTLRGEIIHSVNNTVTKIPFHVLSPQLEKNIISTHKVISEGGPITHDAATLPSDDLALLNLEKNTSVTKGTSIVARKGADFEDRDKKESQENKLDSKNPQKKANNNTHTPIVVQGNGNTSLNDAHITNDVQNTSFPNVLKPKLLSSELLAISDRKNNITIDETGPITAAHVAKAGSHPAMILPIVITILVVPMFAIVAYMALKRGKEAWKNRHYKRMDFLLDGMYND